MPPADPALIVDKLEELRFRLAEFEDARHQTRTITFMQDSGRTVREREMAGDFATLDLNRDILMLRAEIRSLEDRLQVELHALHP